MKRLSNCHRKTPVHKEDKCPNFYELAKTSPLPEINLQSGGRASGGSINPETQIMPGISHGQMPQFSSLSQGNGVLGPNSVTSLGSLGGQMGNVNNNLYSHLLTSDNRSMGMGNVQQPLPNSALPRLLQLQRDNEDLRRRIMVMENKQSQGSNQLGMNHLGMNQHSMIPDQFGTMSANLGGGSIVKQELGRMQRDMMMQNPSNTMTNSMNNPVNNSMNNSLLSSLGGSGNGGSSGNAHNFMSGFPRDEMLLRAMRLENQMGYQQQASSSVMSQMEHNALQQNNGGLPSTSGSTGAASTQGCQDDRREAMMEWMEKQQQNDVPSI
mmetsp:Transcript_19956/g.37562  ORF Transcript_19956/g.37562 Transcript_19956/m.37562 type:complete len:324 (-) Transcript_19956:770-1741(-)